ncbi:hypothetical protein FPZ12_035140 [Amycolatopsis acidicola]|uniref:Antigen 84 n=1 Tax=Amycolatopsis acidicola TaxID=2596893 RepID=A0A5N0UR17_9PSEU|nr:hypothetical protein [Amycolatopsis acidicola]KAA9153158.1 hypothetical protein FPZ12_035140 [Amycolatopsis acidicola]
MAESLFSDEDAEREPEFGRQWRGYSEQEVDEYVRKMRTRAKRQGEALRQAEERLAGLNADLSVPLEVVGSGGIGARVERIVAQAEAEAREIRETAEKEAAQSRKEIEEEADTARRHREAAAKAAAEEARTMIAEAEAEVERLREVRKSLLEKLTEIGDKVDDITGRGKPTAPKPRAPLTKPKIGTTEPAASSN